MNLFFNCVTPNNIKIMKIEINKNHSIAIHQRYWLLFYTVIFFFTIFVDALAVPPLTPEQTELLKQLTPEQQNAALQSLQSKSGTVVVQKPVTEVTPPVVVVPNPTDLTKPSNPTDLTKPSPIEKQIEAPQRSPNADEQKAQAAPEVLQQFGYDLFSGTPTTFAPATDIPVPLDYVIGPGDSIEIQIFGKISASYTLIVSRDGELNFPSIGPIPVAGMKFSELRENLMDRVASQMIGNKANITMGQLRSIRVLILGEAQHPGSYTISALSTLTNALLVSGGVKPIGSLRNIQLKRNGQTVVTLDLYDLLLRGDTRSDARLAPGDVLFIPTIGTTVGVAGAVHRPAIYELKDERTIADILKLAGGPLPIAYLQGSQLERISEKGDRSVINLNLRTPIALSTSLQNGDVVRVYSVLDRFNDTVTLIGHVHRPGQVQWHLGMHLTDLIRSRQDLLPRPDTSYVVVRRELPDRHIEVLTVDLGKALAAPKSAQNIELTPMDEVRVFGLDEDRVAVLSPMITQLRQQTRTDQAEPVVTIEGQVRYPGAYPFVRNMRLSDLVKAAVGVLPDSDLGFAVARREMDTGQRIEAFPINLGLALANDRSSNNLMLQPRDVIQVLRIGEDRAKALEPIVARLQLQGRLDQPAHVVTVTGQVRVPGAYPLTKGMRMSDLVKAAAGTLPDVDLGFAVIRREKERGQRITVIQVNLAKALDNIYSEHNSILAPRDHVHIFGLSEDRKIFLDPLLVELRRQALTSEQAAVVEIAGSVLKPGSYPLTPGMRISDLIRAGGNLSEAAYTLSAEITRAEIVNGISRETEHMTLDLAAILSGDLAADLTLNSYDRVTIRPIPNWSEQETVEIRGEVNFPGIYSIIRGETLSSLLHRSGGFTANAFPAGAVFIREDLRLREQKRIDDLAFRLESNLASAQLSYSQGLQVQGAGNGAAANTNEAMSIGNQLVRDLRATKAIGRLVIDLPALLSGPKIATLGDKRFSELNVILRGGDRLYIPQDTQDVSIIGEVYYPTSHIFQEGLERDEYINKSGGATPNANKKQIYIIQANGSVVSNDTGIFPSWVPIVGNQAVHSGDTIVVPLDADKIQPLTFWGEITKILYQIALSAAAMKTVGAL
ncbi:polysaccharide biosynthesis/export protein [Gammaproteobacteria bacterium]